MTIRKMRFGDSNKHLSGKRTCFNNDTIFLPIRNSVGLVDGPVPESEGIFVRDFR
jgi:hypothetical protein